MEDTCRILRMYAGKCKKEIPGLMSMYKNPWPWGAVVLLLYSFHCIACSPPPLQQCPVYSIAHGGKSAQKYVKALKIKRFFLMVLIPY
jgi:hypothetical protein